MDLLTRTLRDLGRLLAPDALFSFAVLAVLLTLELVGRQQAATDVGDALAIVVLAAVGWVALQKHRLSPLGWVAVLGQAVVRCRAFLAQYLHIEIGVDLRGTPPLPRRLPDAAMAVLIGAFVLVFPLLLFASFIPLGLRGVAVHVFYLGYLVFLVVLWLVLLGSTLMAFVIPAALIHDAFINHCGASVNLRRLEGMTLVFYFGLLLLGAWLLPPWVPLAICLLALAVNLLTISLPANPDVKFVWRYRQGSAPIYSIPWGTWVTCEFTLLTLIALDLVLLASGSSVLSNEAPAHAAPPAAAAESETETLAPAVRRKPTAAEIMPITTSLGLTLAWLAPGALVALVLQTVLGRSRDPARPCQPVLHLAGSCPPAVHKAIARSFAARGWSVAKPGTAPGPTDVCVELVEQPVTDRAGRKSWPLHLTVEQLQDAEVLARLARRNEVQLRRRLMLGLERLFKMAASRKFRRGTGVWIAPHLWFIPGMSRDTPEDEWDLEKGTVLSGIIGAPYHRILPRCVRHHAYVMLRALQIDLIFVEDSVSFRRFGRVMRMMFEHYDVFGGRRKIDEIHFQGLPGVRVMIHEYQLDEPFRSELYPEPDYENLGRARILHVFRDRGGAEERLERPLDFTHLPVPSLAR